MDLTAPARFGYIGVRLFVVLSGFCLTYPLAHSDLLLEIAYYWGYALPGRLFEFVLGMAAAMVLARRRDWLTPEWQPRYLLGTVSFAALGVGVATQWSRYAPVADILWGLTFCCLILYAATRHAREGPIFTGRTLVRVGTASYSVYLLHDPLVYQAAKMVRPLGLPPIVLWLGFELVAVPVSIGLGWLFYRCVERHFVGPCPEFRWPAVLGRRFQGSLTVLQRWGATAARPGMPPNDL